MAVMGLKLVPVLVKRLLGPPGLSGLIAGDYWTCSYSKQSTEGVTYLRLPALPHHPPHPIICATHDIIVVVKMVAQNPAVLAN